MLGAALLLTLTQGCASSTGALVADGANRAPAAPSIVAQRMLFANAEPTTMDSQEPEADGATVQLVGRALFASNSAAIGYEAQATLDNLADVMDLDRGLIVEIRGHADNRGDAVRNEALSLRRAVAAADYLVSQGVDADRLQVTSFGANDELPALARRVDFAVAAQTN